MIWSFEFAPLLPLWLVAMLGVAGLVLAGLAISRRVTASWLRAIAIIALALGLANPEIIREERQSLPTTVALVVDRSTSQSLEDRTDQTDRALDHLVEEIGAIEEIELRVIVAEQTGAGTTLFDAANAGLGDVAPDQIGGVIMITDGQVHDLPTTSLGIDGAPLHALITGRADEIDRRIEIDNAPRFGIVGEPQAITYRVLDDGFRTEGTVGVSIFRDGELLAIDSATIGSPEEFQFIVPHGGDIVFEFVAQPLDNELTELNNSAVVELNGVRENLRVLLVSGEPHAGERTWRDLLKSDTSVDLIHFTILRPPEKIDITPLDELALIAFPTRELFSETLDDFDLVIFDRYQEQGALPLVYFDNIVRYVRDGGALLIAAGPDDAGPTSIYSTNLASVLPVSPTGGVIETPFYATVNDLGFRHPVTRDLIGAQSDPPDWSRWFRLVEVEDPVGDVIMEGPEGRPLLVLGHEGEGRVAMLLSDHAWLWARGFEGGGPHADLLRRIAHWLMKEPDLEEEALRATADGNLLTIERQTMQENVEPATLRSPAGAEQQVVMAEVEPGIWGATIETDIAGLWRVAQDSQIAVVHVGPPNPFEFIDPRSTESVLAPLVETSAGYIGRAATDADIPPVAAVPSGSDFGNNRLGIRMTEASLLTGIDRVPLFAGFIGLAILAGLLAMTWYREGR